MMSRNDVKAVELAVTCVDSKEVVECWSFGIDENLDENGNQNRAEKKFSDIQKELRAVLLQILTATGLLPVHNEDVKFKIVVTGKPGCVWPEGWTACDDPFVKNGREIVLASASTGVQTVYTKIVYRDLNSELFTS